MLSLSGALLFNSVNNQAILLTILLIAKILSFESDEIFVSCSRVLFVPVFFHFLFLRNLKLFLGEAQH